MQKLEQAIRDCAYHMWNNAGRPEGEADSFWRSAQSEVLAASLGQIATVKAKSTKSKVPARKRKAA